MGVPDDDELRSRLIRRGYEERRRVERDLHDGVQQHLTLLGLKLRVTEELVAQDPTAGLAMFAELHADLRRGLDAVRELARGIYPPLLITGGLPPVLAEAAERCALDVTFDCASDRRHDPDVEAAVYFCCAEAMSNAVKHAGPGARIRIDLREDGPDLIFEVSDDGRGFEPAATPRGSGLDNLADRLAAVGGRLTIVAAPGDGTRVRGEIPLG